MRCTRCKGLMVPDDLVDMRESSIPMWMHGWRCISCGNIVDPLIQQHRMIQASGIIRLPNPDASAAPERNPVKVPA